MEIVWLGCSKCSLYFLSFACMCVGVSSAQRPSEAESGQSWDLIPPSESEPGFWASSPAPRHVPHVFLVGAPPISFILGPFL